MQNMNDCYKEALNLCEKKFTHNNLIELLKSGSVVEKQFAALNINKLTSMEEAHLLVSNLVGVDGKIREAVALKIFELIPENLRLFKDSRNYEIFSNAIIDIDSNVCRLVINSLRYLIEDEEFSKYFVSSIINHIKVALNEINSFTFKDKKYKINKQNFKIYWCLESIFYFQKYFAFENLKEILLKCSNLSEYTIREKCAKILNFCKTDKDLEELLNKLAEDENYYVRNCKQL